MRSAIVAVLAILAVGSMAGCAGGPDPVEPSAVIDDGSWYVRERWPHDGRPVSSENFIVYSDSASVEARRETAEVAEEVWATLLDEFSIEPALLRYPDGQDKLHVFAYRNRDPQDWEAQAYYGGLIMWSPDNEQRGRGRDTRLAPVLKHELVHVLQSLIAGPNPNPVDVWFFEGVAEAMAGGTTGGVITGRDQLDELTASYGRISPVSVKTYAMIPSPEAGERFDYPMFQLAVDYLLDEDGYGRSPADVRDVLIDVADGASFEVAFEDHMGTTLQAYDDQFFDLMEGYLPSYSSRLFSPVGFWLMAGLVIILVLGLPALAFRRWAGEGVARPGAAVAGRGARLGFAVELALTDAVIIAFYLGSMLVIGTTNELNNEMYRAGRTAAYWILVTYLLLSVGIVVWAVRQWTNRSRLAYLLGPLVLVATAGAILMTLGVTV